MLSNNFTYHSPSDVIKLVIKVCPLNTDHPKIHLLHFFVAVFDDMILALLHLLDLFQLV